MATYTETVWLEKNNTNIMEGINQNMYLVAATIRSSGLEIHLNSGTLFC